MGYSQMVTHSVINIGLTNLSLCCSKPLFGMIHLDIIILQVFISHIIIFGFVLLDSRPLQSVEEIMLSLKSKNLMRISNIMDTCGKQPPEYFVTRLFNFDAIIFFWVEL